MKYLRLVLTDLKSLSKASTALALVALVAQLFPSVHFNGTLIAGVLGGVGVLAAFAQKMLDKSGYSLLGAVKAAIQEIPSLKNAGTAAAIVALIVQLIPGIHINGQVVSGVLSAVGLVATFIAAQIKLANQTSTPTPTPAPAPVNPTPPAPKSQK